MSDLPEYGTLATAYAGLQHSLLSIEGGIAPHASLPPAASGSPTATRVPHGASSQSLAPSPQLIAASKSQPIPVLEAAIKLGITQFGENRVQEAAEKWPALKAAHPGLRLHLIGPLQSNKALEAVALFDVIQTVDRVKIADALAAEMTKQGKRPELLIQVNTGEEPQKGGVAPRDLPALLAHCGSLQLPIVGLMCVPPADKNPAPHFALLSQLAREHGLRELSMGMSGDYEVALRLGATMIRVGTALFGERR